MSRIYTNNINSESGASIDIETGVNVSGTITATSFSGDASGLIGIGVTLIKDNDSTVRVEANTSGVVVTGVLTATTVDTTTLNATTVGAGGSITASSFYGDGSNLTNVNLGSSSSVNTTGVITATSFTGDGSGLTFAPKIIAYNPAALATDAAIGTNITFTFDQNIYFSGTGTIRIRQGSASGTIVESFTISSGTPGAGLSISGTQLIINPSSNLTANTVYYVTLPSQGIANSVGTYYAGSSNYNFQTAPAAVTFTATGGDHTFTRISPTSPTGYYKYHIFKSSGPLVLSADSSEAVDLAFMMVGGGGAGSGRGPTSPAPPANSGGGGGAGGYIARTGPTLGLPSGSYTVTIGAGGPNNPPSYQGVNGTESKVESPTVTLSAAGGGAGAYTSPSPITGLSGASGGGGFAYADNQSANTGSGGVGTPGQGYPGGVGKNVRAVSPGGGSYPTQPYWFGPPYASFGGGGGGAGGAGGDTGGYDYPDYNPTHPAPNKILRYAGSGGNGAPNPNFTISEFAGYVPLPIMPVDFLGLIGPTGLYGGGGGGGSYPSGLAASGGLGGPGGGGWGDPLYFAPAYVSFYPSAYPGSPPTLQTPRDGRQNMGGGGGGSNSSSNGSGGSGIVLIRYAVDI